VDQTFGKQNKQTNKKTKKKAHLITRASFGRADLDGTTFAYNCRTQLAYNLTYVPFTQLQLLAHDNKIVYNLFGLDFAARASL